MRKVEPNLSHVPSHRGRTCAERRLWAAATPAQAHPYLADKGVLPHGLQEGALGQTVTVRDQDGKPRARCPACGPSAAHGPQAPRDRCYEWAYLFGAVCPERGVGAGVVLPFANVGAMSLHLVEVAKQVMPGAHAVVVLDGAGWHKLGGRLRVPDNVTLLPLPPYAPELNPVELISQFLRQNQLSSRVFDGYDAIVDACCSAWNALPAMPERIASIATRPWAKVTA